MCCKPDYSPVGQHLGQVLPCQLVLAQCFIVVQSVVQRCCPYMERGVAWQQGGRRGAWHSSREGGEGRGMAAGREERGVAWQQGRRRGAWHGIGMCGREGRVWSNSHASTTHIHSCFHKVRVWGEVQALESLVRYNIDMECPRIRLQCPCHIQPGTEGERSLRTTSRFSSSHLRWGRPRTGCTPGAKGRTAERAPPSLTLA